MTETAQEQGKRLGEPGKRTVGRADQPNLPGTEGEKNPAVHKAAIAYADIRDERMAANKLESKRKTELMDIMKREGVKRYNVEGVEAELTKEIEEDVKVKVKGRANPEDEKKKTKAAKKKGGK